MDNLAIDIGNTRIKIGGFTGARLDVVHSWPRGAWEEIGAWITNQSVEKVIYSTVSAALPAGLPASLGDKVHWMELNTQTPLPIKNAYRTPESLGKDRLAAVLGAYSLFPGQACLVIDSGTCVTYDLLSAGGVYLGGNISPGWEMRLDAMHHYTARLPRPSAEMPIRWFGDSTQTALQSGAFWGLIAEMEGQIARAADELGPINVLLTGGNAENFAKKLKSEIFVNQNLVLLGLNKILTYNAESF